MQPFLGASGTEIWLWLRRLTGLVSEFKDELNSLDAAAGDGDIGDNLVRGFTAACEMAPVDGNAVDLLRALGDALLNRMGGSCGMLVGLAIRDSLRGVESVEVMSREKLIEFCLHVEESVGRRGHSSLGDRTLLDALSPAVRTAQQSVADGLDLARAVFDAATAGLNETRSMMPRKGRSFYVAERAMGYPDAGSLFVVLACAALHPALSSAAVGQIDLLTIRRAEA